MHGKDDLHYYTKATQSALLLLLSFCSAELEENEASNMKQARWNPQSTIAIIAVLTRPLLHVCSVTRKGHHRIIMRNYCMM